MALNENNRYIVHVYVGALSAFYEALSVEASKQTTAEEIVSCIVERLSLNESPRGSYELAEVIGDSTGQECKERSLGSGESPVQLMMLWPKTRVDNTSYRFYLREKVNDYVWRDSFVMDPQLIKDYFNRFLYQPKDREYPDLCQLPDLNEQTLLDNLRARFSAGHIYTYVGSILIAVNPFKFYPIYNPKYVKLYQNRRLGPNLPPHIFAVADTAYHCMLKDRKNQCIVISGESGSGKTESTNFLLHHLTALSQKGSHGSGVEQTILSAGPVLEAFGNAKTAHNNNSSRFGKFIQVNYKENGMVHGAVVQKYLLEKSRICTQGRFERNYHVFYYLLEGASDLERQLLHLKSPDKYKYLNARSTSDNVDESYEFSRLKQSMEMVGFTAEKQRRLFSVLSAVLLLGNVEFQPRKSAYHHDEAVAVKNPEIVSLISELLRVKQETLLQALTAKRAKASGETLVINYRLPEAVASRDAMAKCLYGALFDWIVLQVNHALLSKKDTLREHQGNSIGVLDIFGFEDFGLCNGFEQLCINYANEHLQYYFNQHVFKYEQEEYRKEGIRWTNIDFMDNTGCLQLIEGKPNGLLCLLDDQCNFPGATNETLLQKFNTVHKDSRFYQKPQRREGAFIVVHYAGKVKYQVSDMREKNLDLMRQDIVGVLKNSSMAFVRELVGADPVAVFRWAIVRAFFRAYFAFHEAGRRHRQGRVDGNRNNIQQRYGRAANHVPNDNIIRPSRSSNPLLGSSKSAATFGRVVAPGGRNGELETGASNSYPGNNRLSWPQFYQRNRSSAAGGAQPTQRGAVDEERSAKRKESVPSMGGSGSAVLERVLCASEARVMQKANQIVMKNKSFRPRERGKKGLKNLQSVKTLAGRTGLTASSQAAQIAGKARKQPLTVTAQFQQSLHSLMDTLNQANPFFIRCIKSNGNKVPNEFDDETVQRQLRYTGMLETVRIRQAGFNVRLTYDEFIQLYRILLPKGLLSSQIDVRNFLYTLNLDRDNYQLGSSKIFLRESEKYKLDCKLHQQIMASIVTLQRWFRACLERRRFLRIRKSVVVLQSYCRSCLVRRRIRRSSAAVKIQKVWRGYRTRTWWSRFKISLVQFQAHGRGLTARRRLAKLKGVVSSAKTQSLLEGLAVLDSSNSFAEVLSSSKESSHEDLDIIETSGSAVEDSKPEVAQYKLSLRSTLSLPSVAASTRSSTTFPQIGLEDTKHEGVLLEPVSNRQLDEIMKYRYHQQQQQQQQKSGSSDSLGSHGSFDSIQSAESQPTRSSNPLRRHEQWSSNSLKSETDSECGTTFSAPPIVGDQPRYDHFSGSEVWQKMNQKTDVWQKMNQKAALLRSPQVNLRPHALVKREKFFADGFSNLPPVRRTSRDDFGSDRTPNKTEEILGKPKVPLRNVRKQHKRGHVKSLGEEVTDGSDGSKGVVLRTIDEKITNEKITSKLLQNEIEWSKQQSLTPTKRQKSSFGSLDLKRRNSDPAAKVTISSAVIENPHGDSSPKSGDDLQWQSTTTFTIGGHRFGKNKVLKGEVCAYCNEEVHEFRAQGHRCSDCRKHFHTKCIQNRNVLKLPCESKSAVAAAAAERSGRRKHRKHSKAPYDLNGGKPQGVAGGIGGNSKFSLTKTSEFTDRTDQIISDTQELQSMQQFITGKICKIESSEEGKKPSEVDRLFKQALREFKDNLVQVYSSANRNSEAYSIKYKDLIVNFMQAMETVCQSEQQDKDFPVTMGVNAFRGFMDEFMMSSRPEEKMKERKRKKDKKRKSDDLINHSGHTFLLTIINIPTACEICSSFFMWPIERGLVCQSCKLTCHKKNCYTKSPICTKDSNQGSHRLFGVRLGSLLSDENAIPVAIERLLATIEMRGLYVEGLYRKSGVSSKVRELKAKMEESPDDVNFENYQIHVLASVFKTFLREMPEPLLTFECYENFITAANMTDAADRVTTLYDILRKLPKPNFDLMERLVFHLARVALHEEVNRMSAASLAIVFAPCILRTNKVVPAQDSLHDIGSQTQCIETVITEQLRKVRSTLDDIDTLDTACQAATKRLTSLRRSKVFSPEELLQSSEPASVNVEDEENLLEDHIQEIQKEKDHLTLTLPILSHTSDDDMLSTDGDGSLDDISNMGGMGCEAAVVKRQVAVRGPIVRSVSGGEQQHQSQKLKRQTSGDAAIVKISDEDAPIMV